MSSNNEQFPNDEISDVRIRNCKKPKTSNGLTRAEANRVAASLGIDYMQFSKKDDLCEELLRAYFPERKSPVNLRTPRTPKTDKSPKAAKSRAKVPKSAKISKVSKTSKESPKKRTPKRVQKGLPLIPIAKSKGEQASLRKSVAPLRIEPLPPSIRKIAKEQRKKVDLSEIQRAKDAKLNDGPTNAQIAAILRRRADKYQGEDAYRANALNEAAYIIGRFPIQITDPDVQLKDIPKIGKGTIRRVKEIILTGTLNELDEAGPNSPLQQAFKAQHDAINELTQIHGIGTNIAEMLISQDITSIDDLIDKYNKGEIDLTNGQILGIRYLYHLNERIPRDVVTEAADIVKQIAHEIDPNIVIEVLGSYRRGLPTSGDVDIWMTDPDNKNYLAELVQRLKDIGFIEYVLSFGKSKFQGIFFEQMGDEPFPMVATGNIVKSKDKLARLIDIRYVPYGSWGAALLHATGSDRFNVYLREIAKSKDLSLSEFGLKDVKTKEVIPFDTEEDIFEYLEIPYVPPQDRNM